MAIPKYSEFYNPILKLLRDEKIYSTKEIKAFCIEEMHLSEEDIKETFANGNLVLPNRIGWALTYLKKAQLISNNKRSLYQITKEGIRTVNEEGVIDTEYLRKYDSFCDFVKKTNIRADEGVNDINQESPLEAIDAEINKINETLADELMAQVMKMDPYEFEILVMKVLEKMGYGTAEGNLVTKKSNDEGIDGVITEDQLGFDKIYIQVKQWNKEHLVSRPEVQKFLGAVAGQGGVKGLFITTSDFTSGAVDFVKKQLNQKIVLINGRKFMQYMIKHNIGVSVESVYEIKKIDFDFFNNEI